MSSQCFHVQKQSKFCRKHQNLIEGQLMNNEPILFETNHLFQSPKSGKSQTLTETSSSTKIHEKMIDEIDNVLVCEVDNQEYTVQTISFTNTTDLKRAAVNLRKVFRNLVMPVNELRVESTTDGFQKLQIITKKFVPVQNPSNVEEMCKFAQLLIKSKIQIWHNDDVIRYLDGSIHINPMALIRTQQQFMPLHKLLINLFSDQNIPLDFRILIQIVKLYEDRDLEALLAYRPQDQELFIFQQTLLNLLLCQQY